MFSEVIGQNLQRRELAGSNLNPGKFSDALVHSLSVDRALSRFLDRKTF